MDNFLELGAISIWTTGAFWGQISSEKLCYTSSWKKENKIFTRWCLKRFIKKSNNHFQKKKSAVCQVSFWRLDKCISTRWGRPRWYQTLHRLAPPLFKTKTHKKTLTPDTWHLTPDTWHVTGYMWHGTHGMSHMSHDRWGEVNLLSKFQLPSS